MKLNDYTNNRRVLWLFSCVLILLSCGNDDSTSKKNITATTLIMQRIAENSPHIQAVEKDVSYQLYDGIQITDAVFTYYTRRTRMLIAEIDLTKNLTFATCTPDNKDVMGELQQITAQALKAEESGKKVFLGINGDVYGFYQGKDNGYVSAGVFYKDGKIIKDTAAEGFKNVFCVLKDGSVRLCSFDEFQQIKDKAMQALGGWERLLENGERVDWPVNNNTMLFNPRTFIGVSKDNLKVYIFVIDGRQPDYSNGMRVEDMMYVCEGAGCYHAMNLDGGGSTTIVKRTEQGESVRFEIMNQPSDKPARAVANGLLVIEKK